MSPKARPFADVCGCCRDLLAALGLSVAKYPGNFSASEFGGVNLAFGVSSKSISSGMKLGMGIPFAFLGAKFVTLVVDWLAGNGVWPFTAE
jgi:hypothetical protein